MKLLATRFRLALRASSLNGSSKTTSVILLSSIFLYTSGRMKDIGSLCIDVRWICLFGHEPGRVGTAVSCPPTTRISIKISFEPSAVTINYGLPAGGAFFSLRAQRKEPKERAARPLRRPRSPSCGTGGAKTRCAQTVCPFIRFRTPPPGSAARAPPSPDNLPCTHKNARRGGRFRLFQAFPFRKNAAQRWRHIKASRAEGVVISSAARNLALPKPEILIVPTLQRGNLLRTLQRPASFKTKGQLQ